MSNYRHTDRAARLETGAERVARALTSEHEIKVVIGSEQGVAHFNLESRVLTIPAFDTMPPDPGVQDAWRGVLDHECAHAVYTDRWILPQLRQLNGTDGGEKIHHLWNVLEDKMIERRWVEEYPGSVRHFREMSQWADRVVGTVETTDPEHKLKNGNEIGVFGAFARALSLLARGSIEWSQVHPTTAKLLDLVSNEIRQGFEAKNSTECMRWAKEIWEKLKPPPEPPPPPPPPQSGGDEDADEEPDSGDGGQQDADGPGECEDSGEESPNSDEPGNDDDGTGSSAQEDDEEEAEAAPGGSGASKIGDGEEEEEGEGAGSGGLAEIGGDEDDEEEEAEAASSGIGRAGVEEDLRQQFVSGDFAPLDTEWQQELWKVLTKHNQHAGVVPYVVHPDAEIQWVTYRDREKDAENVRALTETARKAANKLRQRMANAIMASSRKLTYGPVEDGDDISDDALSGIALRNHTNAIFDTTQQRVSRSAFVTLLVDCSGSMGSNSVHRECPVSPKHQISGDRCGDCGSALVHKVASKSGRAAVTAMALHQALKECRVPHAVLGYNTGRPSKSHGRQLYDSRGMPVYSRINIAVVMHEFVPAPGFEKGDALVYVNGAMSNVDGESVLEAARYTYWHGKEQDRHILMVIADGLPVSADGRADLMNAHLTQSVERIAQSGMEVYGIGVGISDHKTFAGFYPTVRGDRARAPTGSILLPNSSGLTDVVLKQITDLVTEGYGRSRR